MAIGPHDMVQLVNAKVIGSKGKTYMCSIGALEKCYIPKSLCEYDEFTGVLLVKRWKLNAEKDKWGITFSVDKQKAYGSETTLPPIHYINAIRAYVNEIQHCLNQLENMSSPVADDDGDDSDETEC